MTEFASTIRRARPASSISVVKRSAMRAGWSSLYGSDAIGGVVNILPRLGGERAFEPFASVSVGEFDTLRGLAGASGSTGKLDYSVTLETLDSEGYDVVPERIATATGDPDGSDFTALTANARYALTGAISLEALVRTREASNEFDTFSGGPTGFQRGDDADLFSEDAYTVWRTGLAYKAGGLTSRVRAGQVLNALESFNDGALTDTYEGARSFAEWLTRYEAANLGPFSTAVLSAGLEFENEDIVTDTAFNAPLSVAEDHAGVFAVAQAGLGARLDLLASARVDDYEGFDIATTGNIGAVVYVPEIATRFTLSYGSAFNAPTLSERFASSPFVTPNPDLEPEESTSVELEGDNVARVHGDLTIRDVTREFELPFTLQGMMDNPMQENTTVAGIVANAQLMRTDYGVGVGDWAATAVVGDEVNITLNLELNTTAI